MGNVIIFSVISLGVLGVLFGVGLALTYKFLAVEIDPRVEKVLEILPGINCGACGYPGCSGYAQALVVANTEPNLCAPGGAETVNKIASILGIEVEHRELNVAVIHCRGLGNMEMRYEYAGVEDCRACVLLGGGISACRYGCLGLYSCVAACRFGAISPDETGSPVVDPEKCVGCRECIKTCPRELIDMVPKKKTVHVMCRSQDRGKEVMQVCKVGCIACTKCVKACPEKFSAMHMAENLAEIDYVKCTCCGLCVKACPTNAIRKIARAKQPVASNA